MPNDGRALLSEILAELRLIREGQEKARLMLARSLAMQLALSRPMSAEAAERVERRLMAMDGQP